MKVRYSRRARADIERIFRYIDERSPSGAHNVLHAIAAAVEQIVEHPHGSEQTNKPNVRVKFVIRYPYKIFYRIDGDAVVIAHVRHTSRRPWGRA